MRVRVMLTTMVLPAVLWGAGAGLDPWGSGPAELEEAGSAALAAGNVSTAYLLARRWLERDPDDVQAALQMARVYAEASAPAAGLPCLQRALQQTRSAKHRCSLLMAKGALHAQVGEPDAAYHAYTAALESGGLTDPVTRAATESARWEAYAALMVPFAWEALVERAAREAAEAPDSIAAQEHAAQVLMAAGDRAAMALQLDHAIAAGSRDPVLVITRLEQRLATLRDIRDKARKAAMLEAIRPWFGWPETAGSGDPRLAQLRRLFDAAATQVGKPTLPPPPPPEPGADDREFEAPEREGRTVGRAQRFLAAYEKEMAAEHAVVNASMGILHQAADLTSGKPPTPEVSAQLPTVWRRLALAERGAAYRYQELKNHLHAVQRYKEDFEVGVIPSHKDIADAGPVLEQLRAVDETALYHHHRNVGGVLQRATELLDMLPPAPTPQPIALEIPEGASPDEVVRITDRALLHNLRDTSLWLKRFEATRTLGMDDEAAFAAAQAHCAWLRAEGTKDGAAPAPALVAALRWTTDRMQQAAARVTALTEDPDPTAFLAAIDQVLRLNPASATVRRAQYRVYSELGMDAAAAEAFGALWRLDAAEGLPLDQALMHTARAGQFPLLMSLADAFVRENPRKAEGYYYRYLAGLALRRRHLAAEAAASLAMTDHRAAADLGLAYYDLLESGKEGLKKHSVNDTAKLVKTRHDSLERRLWVGLTLQGMPGVYKAADHAAAIREPLADTTASAIDAHIDFIQGKLTVGGYQRACASGRDAGVAHFLIGLAEHRKEPATRRDEVREEHLRQALDNPALPLLLRAFAFSLYHSGKPVYTHPLRAADVYYAHNFTSLKQILECVAPGQLTEISGSVQLRQLPAGKSVRLRGGYGTGAVAVLKNETLRPAGQGGVLLELERLALGSQRGYQNPGSLKVAARAIANLRDVDVRQASLRIDGALNLTGGMLRAPVATGSKAVAHLRTARLASPRAEWRGQVWLRDCDAVIPVGGWRVRGNGRMHAAGGVLAERLSSKRPAAVSFIRVDENSHLNLKDVDLVLSGAGAVCVDGGGSYLRTADVSAWWGPSLLAATNGGRLPESGIAFTADVPKGRRVTVNDAAELVRALSTLQAGDNLVLGPGTYDLSERHTLAPGVELEGAGPGKTTVRTPYGVSCFFAAPERAAITVRGMTFEAKPTYSKMGASKMLVADQRTKAALGGTRAAVRAHQCVFTMNTPSENYYVADIREGVVLLQDCRADGRLHVRGSGTVLTDEVASGQKLLFSGEGMLSMGSHSIRNLVVRGASAGVRGNTTGMRYEHGAGDEPARHRYALGIAVRNANWEKAKAGYLAAMQRARTPNEREQLTRQFYATVTTIGTPTSTTKPEVAAVVYPLLKPFLEADHRHAGELLMATAAVDKPPALKALLKSLSPETRRHIRAYAGGVVRSYHARADDRLKENAYDFELAFPPGHALRADAFEAWKRGLTVDGFRAEHARKQEARRKAEQERQTRRLAMLAEQQRARERAAEQQARYQPQWASRRSYTPSYTPSYSSRSSSMSLPSTPQWTPSWDYQKKMYRAGLWKFD